MSSSNCYFLTCIQISQETGQVTWYSHLFQNFPEFVVVHTVKTTLNIIVIQVYAPTSNGEEIEVEQFYEDLQDLLELTPQKDVLFILADWNAKVGSQETSGVTGKFGFGVQNEAGQKVMEFCQESKLVIANTFFNNTRDDSIHGHHQMVNTKIRLIIFFSAKEMYVR